MRGDRVHIRTVSGRGGRDEGSESNAPLPARDVQGFRFGVADGRGGIRLVSPPSCRNRYQAVVYIRDCAEGEGRYHFRLSWIRTGGGVFPGISATISREPAATRWGSKETRSGIARHARDQRK